ncbi:glycosyltransferase family 2 protein [candidate division CSSED10-310 bacterium]|uniref:Glycosyltransferase family 2 protein n=1 Tax=candidate division CSSED10-310 bacterium TaxID=2855610 RepID=A0ABV6YS78_UNCC1
MSMVTVLMTVFNGERYLHETITSVLNQTFTDFTFLVIDNASTDNSLKIVHSFNDQRLKLEALPENIGQVPALNKGLDMITTPYIARIDADDICLPQRLEKQVAFMENNVQVGICGTYAMAFKGKQEIAIRFPLHTADIKVKLLFECCLGHPSVMMRKELLDRYQLRYNEQLGHSEDWELWQRAANCFDLANIPEFLLRYRLHAGAESHKVIDRQKEAATKLDAESLKHLKLQNHPLRTIHRDVATETFNARNREPQLIHDVEKWFELLKEANQNYQIYAPEALQRFLKERLFIVLTNNTGHWRTALTAFHKHKLGQVVPVTWTVKFYLKILWAILTAPKTPPSL